MQLKWTTLRQVRDGKTFLDLIAEQVEHTRETIGAKVDIANIRRVKVLLYANLWHPAHGRKHRRRRGQLLRFRPMHTLCCRCRRQLISFLLRGFPRNRAGLQSIGNPLGANGQRTRGRASSMRERCLTWCLKHVRRCASC